jgi:hypothetical protein
MAELPYSLAEVSDGVSDDRSEEETRRMARIKATFGALVLAQAAHSIEEYVGRLWESFPPARFLSGLISADRELGFLIMNIALVAFGIWCFLWPVRRNWPSATALMWFWIVIETINGIAHPIWTLRQGGYTPGVLTAPILLVLALSLAFQLRRTR